MISYFSMPGWRCKYDVYYKIKDIFPSVVFHFTIKTNWCPVFSVPFSLVLHLKWKYFCSVLHYAVSPQESRLFLLVQPGWIGMRCDSTVPSICSGSQGRERWLHHAASTQQLPDLPCSVWVGWWGFFFFCFCSCRLCVTAKCSVGASSHP